MDRIYHKISVTIAAKDPDYGKLVMRGSQFAFVENHFYCGPANDAFPVLTPFEHMQHFFWVCLDGCDYSREFSISKEDILAEMESLMEDELTEEGDDTVKAAIEFLQQILDREPDEECYTFIVY